MKQNKLSTEHQFQLILTLGESLVGPVLRFLDNRATTVDIRIVKENKPGGNNKRGSFTIALVDILKKADKGMSMPELKKHLVDAGFSKAMTDTTLYSPRAKKLYTRKNDLAILKKGVA